MKADYNFPMTPLSYNLILIGFSKSYYGGFTEQY